MRKGVKTATASAIAKKMNHKLIKLFSLLITKCFTFAELLT